MHCPQTGATRYHTQLRLPDKGLAIKGSDIFFVVWLKQAPPLVLSIVVIRMAFWQKYHNSPVETKQLKKIVQSNSVKTFQQVIPSGPEIGQLKT